MKKIILLSFLLLSSLFSISQTRVLYWVDGLIGTDQMSTALTNTGCIVTTATSDADFQTLISTPANYDMAIYFCQNNASVNASAAALANFVNLGKKGMYADWSADATNGALVGVSYTGTTNESTVTVTDPALAAGITTNPFTITNTGWGVYSYGLVPLAGGTIAGTFSPSGQAAIVKSMSDNMLVFGYLSDVSATSEMYEIAVETLTTSITTSAFSGIFCPNASLNVPYTITGTYNGTNVFTAELSDASGSFASPTAIGTLSSAVAGTITATIPLTATTGTGYRIRVTSSTPGITGTNNGTDLTISAPVATATSTAILCNGGTASVTVVGSAGTAPYTNEGTFPVSAGTYSYTIIDANACSATATGTITEPALLIASATSTAILCNGGTASVTVVGSAGTAPYTNEGTFPVSAGTYSYTIIDANACSATATGTITEPAVITSTQTISLCPGQSVTIGSSTYSSAGTFTDVLSAFNTCDSAVTTTIAIATLDLTTSSAGLTLSANTATAAYQWLDCNAGNSPIVSAVNQSYTATTNGSYAVQITENGCVDTSACIVIATTGITAIDALNIVNIYPNPANELFTVSIQNTPFTSILIEIVDIQGKIIFSTTDTNLNSNFSKEIHTEDISKGLYYVNIKSNEGLKVYKLIIQ
jgi:Secretion system C-terminal sorting domain